MFLPLQYCLGPEAVGGTASQSREQDRPAITEHHTATLSTTQQADTACSDQ